MNLENETNRRRKPMPHQRTMRRIMLRMVSVEGGELARRRVPLSELKYRDGDEEQRVKEVLDALIDARLVVTGKEPDGEPYAEPAHDALVRGWDKLLEWRQESQEELTLRGLLTPAANDWKARTGGLWHFNPRLSLVSQQLRPSENYGQTQFAARDDGWLNADEAEFIEKSAGRRQKILAGIVGVTAAAFLAMGILTLFAYSERNRADVNATTARRNEQKALDRLSHLQVRTYANTLNEVAHLSSTAPFDGLDLLEDTARCPLNLREFTWRYLHRACRQRRVDLVEQKEPITSLALSPDATLLAFGDRSGKVRVWDIPNRKELIQFAAHNGKVNLLSFSPNGELLATASLDGSIGLRQARTGKELFTWEMKNTAAASVCFSASGDKLAVASHQNSNGKDANGNQEWRADIHIWKVGDGSEQATFRGPELLVTSMAFTPDAKEVLAATLDGAVWAWNVNAPGNGVRRHKHDHSGFANSVVLVQKDAGSLQLFVSEIHDAHTWDVGGRRDLRQFHGEYGAISARGSKVAVANAREISVDDLETGGTITIRAPFAPTAMVVSSNAKLLAATDGRQISLFDPAHSPGIETVNIAKAMEPRSVPANGDLIKILPAGLGGQAVVVRRENSEWKAEQFKTRTPSRFAAWSQISQLAALSRGSRVEVWRTEYADSESAPRPAPSERMIVLSEHANCSRENVGRSGLLSIDTVERRVALDVFPEVAWAAGVAEPSCAAFSHDGKYLATAGHNVLRIWDTETLRQLHEYAIYPGEAFHRAEFSPDDSTLALAVSKRIHLWNVREGRVRSTLAGHASDVISLAFSTDGKTLVSTEENGHVMLWDPRYGERLGKIQLKDEEYPTAGFSRDGNVLLTAGIDGMLYVWKAESGTPAVCNGHLNVVNDLAFSPDGSTLGSAGWDGVRIWSTSDGQEQRSFARNGGGFESESALIYASDGKSLSAFEPDFGLRRLNPRNGDIRVVRESFGMPIDGAEFSPDGKLLAIGSQGSIRLYETDAGQEVHQFSASIRRGVSRMTFSSDGTMLACVDRSGASIRDRNWHVRLIRIATGETIRSVEGEELDAHDPAISSDGQTLAVAHIAEVSLWDPGIGKRKATLRGHSSRVMSTVFSPNSALLAVGRDDGTIEVWRVASAEVESVWRGHQGAVNHLAFSPDGGYLASASSDRTVRLWPIATDK